MSSVKGWPPEAEVKVFWALLRRDFTAGEEGVFGGWRVKIANSRTGMVFDILNVFLFWG